MPLKLKNRSPELKLDNQMEFNVIEHFYRVGGLPLCRGYCQCILSPTDNPINCLIIFKPEVPLHSSHYILITLQNHYLDWSAQSAGAIEYTDSTSAEGWDPTPTSVLDMTLNNLMKSWSFVECRVHLHWHLSGPLWPGVVAPDRVLSTSQIELFDI